MADSLQNKLDRWVAAGVLDLETAGKIRAFEAARGPGERLRWPAMLAVALGGVLLGAAILLFVAAHWDEIAPGTRFTLVLLMVAIFPVAGALAAEKFPALSTTFHALGTVGLGAGIALAAQIFNLEENWTNGVLLWTAGALIGWLLLKKWPQAAMLAVLVPFWLVGRWSFATHADWDRASVVWEGLLLLALTYLSARTSERQTPARTAIATIGGIALLPCAILAVLTRGESARFDGVSSVDSLRVLLPWAVAIAAPLCVAFVLRGSDAWMNAIAAVWVLALALVAPHHNFLWNDWDVMGFYGWATVGACGLIAWGIAERRRERVNLGIASFAITVLFFYFSNVMDKLDRAASLFGAGVLLLVGGWGLERARRALMARMQEKT